MFEVSDGDDKYLMAVSGGYDGTCKVWDLSGGAPNVLTAEPSCISTFEGHSKKVTGVDVIISETGVFCISSSADGTVQGNFLVCLSYLLEQ